MPLTVSCPGCRAKLRFARPIRAGAVARCPKCQGVVPLPADDTATLDDRPATTDLTGAYHDPRPQPPTPLMPVPTRLGPYAIMETLGVGGMGRVYRAEDPVLKRQVALKVMLPHLAAYPAAKARFLREAQSQAKVEHDHVVAIHQVGEDDGVPFIAMPLLKGQTLADALTAAPRPPLAEILRIGQEVAEGLAAAHAQGLVHRDIKPSNVWLEGTRRRVKILDFGLARAGGGEADVGPTGPDDTGVDGAVTSAGAVVGTPRFMSPEQARGEAVDFRTDLFSLGVVLYLMTTGELPFGGRTTAETIRAVATHHPQPPATYPDVPEVLSHLIVRLMAKETSARPPSADGVAAEIAEMIHSGVAPSPAADGPWVRLAEEPEPTRPSEPRRRLTAALLAAGGVLVLFVGVMVLIQLMSPPPARLSTDPEPQALRPSPVRPSAKSKGGAFPPVAPVTDLPGAEVTNGLPDPVALPGSARLARGLDGDGLRAWAAGLDPTHVPTALTVRGGTPEPRYDAVALPKPPGVTWRFSLHGPFENLVTANEALTGSGYRPYLRADSPELGAPGRITALFWVRDRTSGWSYWGASRPLVEEKLADGRTAGIGPLCLQSYQTVSGPHLSTVLASSVDQRWEYRLDLERDALARRMYEYMGRGWYPRALSPHNRPTPPRFTVVFAPTPPGVAWEWTPRCLEADFDRLVGAMADMGYRPHVVAVVVESQIPFYTAVWVRPPSAE